MSTDQTLRLCVSCRRHSYQTIPFPFDGGSPSYVCQECLNADDARRERKMRESDEQARADFETRNPGF